jgi:hypothetical protein
MIFTGYIRNLGRLCKFILKVTNPATLKGCTYMCISEMSPAIQVSQFYSYSSSLKVFALELCFLILPIFILTSK